MNRKEKGRRGKERKDLEKYINIVGKYDWRKKRNGKENIENVRKWERGGKKGSVYEEKRVKGKKSKEETKGWEKYHEK